MKAYRLDKFLADAGLGTRSEVKRMLKGGLVSVNGATVKDPAVKIDAGSDAIEYRGERVAFEEHRYYMLNKPDGVVSATEDRNEPTVLSLLKDVNTKDLFPVGRLDKDTEGLLLITDDGELAHKLLSPRYHVDKTYHVTAEGIITDDDIRRLEEGVDIGEKALTLPAKAEMIGSGQDVSEVLLTIHEGKFHQVKRMFEVIGKPVVHLKRISFGSLKLDEKLAPGEFRRLADEEIKALKGR
ncbi:MAG: rRNA pseudouridine synthase [Lachnospiraceae bacterium]|nr:rRNA pseudouridine synthase [Lachnospiraceae bacterium]